MVKARAGGLILLGLSDMNLQKLREGKPIFIDMAEMALPGLKIAIHWGPTEAKIAEEFMEFIGPDTKVTGI